MGVTSVVGANWGDEGKGKIVDFLAEKSDAVIRFQGGANAGHTIINKYGKFALHLVPSGVCHEGTVNILGSGVAVDIEKLLDEIKILGDRGVPEPKILISNRAQILMPYHVLQDVYEEERLGKKAFGSTKSGIAPFYVDKYNKVGIQVADLFEPKIFTKKVREVLEFKNFLFKNYYNKPVIDPEQIIEKAAIWKEKINDMVIDSHEYIQNMMHKGKEILLEGQLGALKDPDNGIFPWVTSSSPLAGFASVGTGIPCNRINNVIAVTKAYSSCVGAGPFVVELDDETGEWLRKNGGDSGEYGATTGRPRRVGWFDAVATKYGCSLQGATSLAITNLDVLSGLSEIPVCDKYYIKNTLTDNFPVTTKLNFSKPSWKIFEGWSENIKGVNSYSLLPDNAKKYLDYIEKTVGVEVKFISTGPNRQDTIIL